MVTDTSKSLRFQKTQMFSQMIDQKEHKNNRYKFEPATWCYKHHSNALWVYPNLITALNKFAPIFRGNNCFRVKYLEFTFTFDTNSGQVEKRQQQPGSQKKF